VSKILNLDSYALTVYFSIFEFVRKPIWTS